MLERRKKYGKLVKDVYAPKLHLKDRILKSDNEEQESEIEHLERENPFHSSSNKKNKPVSKIIDRSYSHRD
jgi:hypothetical protein